MRAFVYDPKGAQHGMSWSEQAPLPTLKAGQLLVSVRAAGINPVDYKLAKLVPSFLLGSRPVGLDVSGVVVESQCSKFPVGSKVFGFGTGSVAESVVVNENEVSMKPDCVTFVEAASLATAALTGYQGLLYGGVTEGKTVLVIGASGGCGLLGIQIARAMVGPRGKVGGICSAANAERVRSLGADITLDYAQPLATQSGTADLGPIDCVYDCVTSPDAGDGLGGDPYDVALAKAGMLAPHTFISAINGDAWKWIWALLGWQRRNFKLYFTQRKAQHLEQLSAWLSDGSLKPLILADNIFPFSAAGCDAAYSKLKSRRVVGKIVIDVKGGSEV